MAVEYLVQIVAILLLYDLVVIYIIMVKIYIFCILKSTILLWWSRMKEKATIVGPILFKPSGAICLLSWSLQFFAGCIMCESGSIFLEVLDFVSFTRKELKLLPVHNSSYSKRISWKFLSCAYISLLLIVLILWLHLYLQCMHGRNCKLGNFCTVGRRLQEVNVLGGLILPVWGTIEKALSKQVTFFICCLFLHCGQSWQCCVIKCQCST